MAAPEWSFRQEPQQRLGWRWLERRFRWTLQRKMIVLSVSGKERIPAVQSFRCRHIVAASFKDDENPRQRVTVRF
jgi:hypothetical protein